jgi:hypothetical protein
MRRCHSEPFGSSPDEQRVADRVGRRELDEPQRLGRQCVELTAKAVLEAGGQPGRGRHGETPRQLGGGHAARQLQQREGISVGLRDDPVADAFVDRPRDDGLEQCACAGVVEPAQL